MTALYRAVLSVLAACQIRTAHGQGVRLDYVNGTLTTNETWIEDKPRVIVCGRLDTEFIFTKKRSTDAYQSRFPWIVALGYTYSPPVESTESLHQNVSNESPAVSNIKHIPYVAHWARSGVSDSPPPNVTGLSWLCGGSLVSTRTVVTAAQCLIDTPGYVLTVARMGDINLDDTVDDKVTAVDYEVASWVAHPEYTRSPTVNDIAVIKLKNEVTLRDGIQPICLPTQDAFRTNDFSGWDADISGWGATEYGGPKSEHLMNGRVQIVEPQVCREAYRSLEDAVIDHRVVCASSVLGMDACQGDAGGPLAMYMPDVHAFYLFGVVSFGLGCGEPGYPGVYTRVSEFIDFILQYIV